MSWNKIQSSHTVGVVCLLIFHVCYQPTDSGAVQITQKNLDMTLASNEIVFINFYAEWCRFSNMLMPIFDGAADEVAKAGYDPGQVVIGKVDCDQEDDISTRFHISKYPTLKIFRNGQAAKKEYRGQRSVEAFASYIKKQLEDPIKQYSSLREMENFDGNRRHIIAYFDRRDQPEYTTLRRVAQSLKDECDFHVALGDVAAPMHPPGSPIIVFRADRKVSNEPDERYNGSMLNIDELQKWVSEKCIPLVRTITFENAEELTEEGLMFLILFHLPNDTDSVKRFKDIVKKELVSEKHNINFLTADGNQFEHPLFHLGKSMSDLPLIAIDSFRHMYLFNDTQQMDQPGRLMQFVQDLYSGKLHREFHYGPDPESITDGNKETTEPPVSTFKKLAPSRNRYTLLRDEL